MKKKSLPIVCAVFLVIAMTVQFFVSYHREKKELVRQLEYKMELAQKDFIFELYDMHEAADEITQFFPTFVANTEELYALLQTVLRHYEDLYCCYITFLPECSPRPGQWSCPTAFRVKEDSVITYDGKNNIPYAERDWYKGALESDDEGYWSLPYNDGIHADKVFTYSRKVYNDDDKLVGVAGADYTLAWTEQLLEDIRPYDDAVCQLLTSDGTLIVGSGDTTKIRDMIEFKKQLAPTDMWLVINVPSHHARDGIAGISLITLSVLLSGILILGLLLHHIHKEQEALARVETANQLMEKEMQIAHDIQMGILKNEDEQRKAERDGDIALNALLLPMREVGGDLYDFYREGDKLWFIIGDVSGKGVPAAMFMAATVNLFRTAVQRLSSPKEIAEELNTVLSDNNPSLTFVTAIIGRLHIPSGQMLYCNAGHCEPLLKHGSTNMEWLKTEADIPLGYDKTFHFTEHNHLLAQDTTLVLYTDGITEARNIDHTMLGCQRWEKIVAQDGNMLEAVLGYIGKAEQTDDITLFAIHKKGTGHKTTNDLN